MREIERDLLRLVAELPVADRIELARLSRWSERAVYQRLGDLERAGLVESLAHASESIRPTRRFLLSEAGIKRLALSSGRSPGEILGQHPVSQPWRRMLLGRLDSVAVIYRLACALAELEPPPRLRWYRSQPADAALGLGDGRTLAVVRWGRTADRTAFGVRLSRLREGPSYSGALVLAPDEVRLRHARRLLRQAPFTCFFALERDAAWANSEPRIWREPNAGVRLSLTEALSYVRPNGRWGVEPSPRGTQSPDSLDIGRDARAPDWLLPARLKPAQKRTLDLVGDWPWIRADHLAPLLGVARRRVSKLTAELERLDLLTAPRIDGKRRLVLSDRGLALLARRDRASVGAARKRWSAGLIEPEGPLEWRNLRGRRTRQLLRNLTHSEAVHGFLAALADQAHANDWRVTQLDPPQRASRYFRFEDRLHSIQPDAFGVLRREGREQPFFLEWERRAIRPSTMAAKLAPYLRYYSAKRPLEHHGAIPLVLVTFDDELSADHFLRVAGAEQQQKHVSVPLFVSDREKLKRNGHFGQAWRTVDSAHRRTAFDLSCRSY
ncbi:MAG: replication-relaxation family protein [Chloroflexi bacterium]|nr:replication-relaxation family protein [Chloroflexota bacterium]MCY3697109.1 replication-relaxation family protein [Chloroflexota bacterium]